VLFSAILLYIILILYIENIILVIYYIIKVLFYEIISHIYEEIANYKLIKYSISSYSASPIIIIQCTFYALYSAFYAHSKGLFEYNGQVHPPWYYQLK
jgi:hypothetical protein